MFDNKALQEAGNNSTAADIAISRINIFREYLISRLVKANIIESLRDPSIQFMRSS